MKTKYFLIITCAIWVIALFNGTGLGNTYHTTEYARYALYAVVMIPVIIHNHHLINKYYFIVFGGMTLVFVGSSLLQGQGLMGLDYLSAFMLIAVMSRLSVTERSFRLTGIAYAVLGMAIIAIYNFGTVLSGWNPNSIAVLGLMSYTFYAASHFFTTKRRDKYLLFAVTLAYFIELIPLNSRSCLMAIVAMFVIILVGKKSAKIMASPAFIRTVLIAPVVIAAFVSAMSTSNVFITLNQWSLENFGKTLTTGRDVIWSHGFQVLFDSFIFGTGEINSGYWHNSAISCLTAYGALGFVLWILSLYILICKGRTYMKDPYVSGCITVFLLIYIQQAFELGFFSPMPNLLMYLPLGLMLGRIKYLKELQYADT